MIKQVAYLSFFLIFGCKYSGENDRKFDCIEFSCNGVKIEYCERQTHPYFAEYERFILLQNESKKFSKKYILDDNTGGRTFINFYLDKNYECKDSTFDVFVFVDKDLCNGYRLDNLKYIDEEYIFRITDNLEYLGTIQNGRFYSKNEKNEERIVSRERSGFCGVPYREENEYRATDLIFQMNNKMPHDSALFYNNVGFIITDTYREKYYVVDLSSKIDTIPICQWIKEGEYSDYEILRFKTPIWQFEYDFMCYEIFKHIGDKVDTLRMWDDNSYYNSELIWKLLKKYKRIEICNVDYDSAKNTNFIKVQSIYNSPLLEKVKKKIK